jgi:tRNA threonylcarbamoyl adenosine modification protein (Sua5/YciO/YrdC/YwlC family)
VLIVVPAAIPAGPVALSRAAEALRAGWVVALPTDTVYGLAVDPTRPGALDQLFSMKARPADVPVPVLVGSRAQATLVADLDAEAATALADQFWPGPLTLVVPRATGFTVDLGGPPSARPSIGIRWPAHPVVVAACMEVGPLAVTSANRHGSAPAVTAGQVAASFADAAGPAVIVDGGRCDHLPSTVVDCQGPTVRCLRQGAVAWDDVLAALTGPTSAGRQP